MWGGNALPRAGCTACLDGVDLLLGLAHEVPLLRRQAPDRLAAHLEALEELRHLVAGHELLERALGLDDGVVEVVARPYRLLELEGLLHEAREGANGFRARHGLGVPAVLVGVRELMKGSKKDKQKGGQLALPGSGTFNFAGSDVGSWVNGLGVPAVLVGVRELMKGSKKNKQKGGRNKRTLKR